MQSLVNMGAGGRRASRRALGQQPLCAGVLALLAACGTAALVLSPGVVVAQVNEDARVYQIASGSLKSVLDQFLEVSGVKLVLDGDVLQGAAKPSAGLNGRYTVRQALDALLRPHELMAVPGDAGIYTTQRLPRSSVQSPVTQLQQVTVTGVGEADVYTVPAAVAVVTREEIDRLPPRNTSDVLRDVSGVYTSQGRSDPGVSINIRGLQDYGRVNVMIDGARQNFQSSGHGANGRVYIDPALIGGVEVTKGPMSTVGGAGMIAGAVNFRTLDVGDILDPGQRAGGQVTAATGSNAYHFSGSASAGLRASENLDLVAAVSRKSVGAFQLGKRGSQPAGGSDLAGFTTRSTGQDQWSGLFKTTWRPAPDHSIKFGYLGLKADFSNGGGGAGSDPTSETASSQDRRSSVRADTLSLEHQWRPASTWFALDSQLYYNRTRRSESRANVFVAPGQETVPAYSLQYQTSTLGGSIQNRALLPGRWVDTTFLAGGEFYYDWTDPQAQSNGVGEFQENWFTGATPKGERTVASGFAQMTVDHDDWLQLIGGLRYDWYSLKGSGDMRVGSISNPGGVRPPVTQIYTRFNVDRHAAALAPKLTLSVKPVRHVQLYASYGYGLRPPSITESLMYGMHSGNMFPYYPSPDLKEERSRNWEIGANFSFDNLVARNDRLRIKTGWFNNRVKNYITSAAIMTPVATTGCTSILCPTGHVNLRDPVRFQGLELDLDYDAGTVFGKLSVTRVQANMGSRRYDPFPLGSWVGFPDNSMGSGNVDGTVSIDGLFYSGPPKLKLGVVGGVRLFDRSLELGARMRLEKPSGEEIYALHAPARNIRTYDLWATWLVNKSLTLRLAVDNLTDKNYLELAGTGGGYTYGSGRTAIATAQWRF